MSTASRLEDSSPVGSNGSVQPVLLRPDVQRLQPLVAAQTKGASLEIRTALRGKPIRDAVGVLSKGVVVQRDVLRFNAAFSPRWSAVSPRLLEEQAATRIAWNLVATWLLAVFASENKDPVTIMDAEKWFRADIPIPTPLCCADFSPETLWHAEQLLKTTKFDEELWNLLPYIFEEHGQGSRSSVMRNPLTAKARTAKRREGVFYTPTDVADYMAREAVASNCGAANLSCFDPACGTGVFLLAVLNYARELGNHSFDAFAYVTRYLYGTDISGQALDSCAFLLLMQCWPEAPRHGLAPWTAWHRMRLNLVQVNALDLTVANSRIQPASAYERVIAALNCNDFIDEYRESPANSGESTLFGAKSLALNSIFPAVGDGFACVIGNPPYAAATTRSDRQLDREFQSLPDSVGTVNLYPLFIEMMWKFATKDNSSGALVTPLSIAYHTGTQFENCRRAMSAAGGQWRFAFFDREPHALFGEEVKTRNAILFYRRSPDLPRPGELAEIETGPLRKWTSRTRSQLFKSIDFTSPGRIAITFGIPKLNGASQAAAFEALQRRHERLPALCSRIVKARPVETLTPSTIPKVFVGGTAYNFLNVYREADLPDEARMFLISESPVHCLEFHSETDAEAALAILCSRLVFWLWHVLGDGFHVSSRLFQAVPFSRRSFPSGTFLDLAALGRQLWLRLQEHQYTALNGGRTTFGYRPLKCSAELDEIDACLGKAAGLSDEFLTELRMFVRSNAVVDVSDDSRAHLRDQFND
jgi:hypothetical protein